MKKVLVTMVAAALTATTMAQVPAFPGAEGHGRYTTGGRGGKVIHVTNLNDSGTGSLREAVKGDSKKTVVFDVGGIIALESNLNIGANTTIAGQTAPGQGITVRYYTLGASGDNIIVRFIRFRRGQERNINDGADAAFIRNRKNIIFDHCSFSWSIDEVASFYDNRDFTMQWCTIGEALNNAGHGKGAHGYGGIWGGKNASFHHNLIIHCNNRTPRFNGARYAWDGYDTEKYINTVDAERVDFRNCVIYNWGGGGCYGGPGGGYINMVNNYYKAGPGTKNKNQVTQISTSDSGNSDGCPTEQMNLKSLYYINGNYVDGYGENYDWQGVSTDRGGLTQTDVYNMYGQGAGKQISVKLTEEIDPNVVTTHDAQNAFTNVTSYAGASLVYDGVDSRYMQEAQDGLALYYGSNTSNGLAGMIDIVADQGTYAIATASRPADFDSDKDGIPDTWETENGMNPNNASDANKMTVDTEGWYTNLEVYLNSIVQLTMRRGNLQAINDVKHYYPRYIRENGNASPGVNLPSGIADITTAEVVSSTFYNMQGVKIEQPGKGAFIRVDIHADGKKTSRKVFIR